jgi:hypothetical protein
LSNEKFLQNFIQIIFYISDLGFAFQLTLGCRRSTVLRFDPNPESGEVKPWQVELQTIRIARTKQSGLAQTFLNLLNYIISDFKHFNIVSVKDCGLNCQKYQKFCLHI